MTSDNEQEQSFELKPLDNDRRRGRLAANLCHLCDFVEAEMESCHQRLKALNSEKTELRGRLTHLVERLTHHRELLDLLLRRNNNPVTAAEIE